MHCMTEAYVRIHTATPAGPTQGRGIRQPQGNIPVPPATHGYSPGVESPQWSSHTWRDVRRDRTRRPDAAR
jgi:hypothetical protein